MWEMSIVQLSFMRHYKVDRCEDLVIPDGDYLVMGATEHIPIRLIDGKIWVMTRKDEKVNGTVFDTENATVIG